MKEKKQTKVQVDEVVETTETAQPQANTLTFEQLQENYNSLLEENNKLIADIEEGNKQMEKLNKTVARMASSAEVSDKYRDQLVALKSDFDSYKKRMRNDTENSIKQGRGQAVELMLPLIDTFGFSKAHLTGDSLVAFEMVEKEMFKVLETLGVEEIEAMGLPFDANSMNALSSMDRGEENTDKVVEVYQRGFKLGEKVLRYAQVIVGA